MFGATMGSIVGAAACVKAKEGWPLTHVGGGGGPIMVLAVNWPLGLDEPLGPLVPDGALGV